MDNIEIKLENGASMSIDPRYLDSDLPLRALDEFLEEKKSKRLNPKSNPFYAPNYSEIKKELLGKELTDLDPVPVTYKIGRKIE